MVLPWLTELYDLSLFLLRLVVALVFAYSGWSHVTKPRERGESLGFGPGATLALGLVEVLGAAMLVLGLWPQLAALALMGVMVGAIWKKMFVWRTGLWGESAGGGWYYDVLYLTANLVIAATGGGAIGLT